MLLLELKHPKQQKTSTLDQLRQIRDSANDPNLVFCTYTDINKLGINPRSNYETPIGIYAYPIDYVLWRAGRVPFGIDRPTIQVFECDPDARIWKLEETKKSSYALPIHNAIQKLYNMDSGISEEDNCYRIWYKLSQITQNHSTNVRPTVMMTKVLKIAGMDGVWDLGYGIICPAEPVQVVFFNPSQLTLLKSVDNGVDRISTRPENISALQSANFEETMSAALNLPHRNRRVEQLLLSKIAEPEEATWLLKYINKHVHTRWPEAEPAILTNSIAIVDYATNILNRRWKVGEQALLARRLPPLGALEKYAYQVVKGRWIEAEPFLASVGYVWRRYKTKNHMPDDYQPPSTNY
jgi:hypothetical protein